MDYIKLTLPLPPSVNGLYAGKVRRYKSSKYKDWIQRAYIELKQQETYTIYGSEWLEVKLWLYTPIYNKDGSKKKKDVDNYMKALFDFLWDNIEGFDDKNIKKLEAEKHQSTEDYILVFIKEINVEQS